MKQTVSVKELKSGGYTRFPRLFIDLLLQDYYPKNKTRLKIGVFIYIFGKLANKPYNYRYAGGKRVSIYEGHHPYHDHGQGIGMFLIRGEESAERAGRGKHDP